MRRLPLARCLVWAVGLLVLAACSDDDQEAGRGPGGFPDAVDTRWVYERVDSLGGLVDTLYVRVSGETSGHGGQVATLWDVTSRKLATQDTVWAEDDTTVVQRTLYRGHHFFRTSFHHPFEVGKSWLSGSGGAMTTVVRDSFIYPIPPFIDGNSGAVWRAFLLEDRWAAGSSNGIIRTWMTPNFGIHHIHVVEHGVDPLNETWRLIQFYDPTNRPAR